MSGLPLCQGCYERPADVDPITEDPLCEECRELASLGDCHEIARRAAGLAS